MKNKSFRVGIHETFQNRIIATTDWYLIESMDKTFQHHSGDFSSVT